MGCSLNIDFLLGGTVYSIDNTKAETLDAFSVYGP